MGRWILCASLLLACEGTIGDAGSNDPPPDPICRGDSCIDPICTGDECESTPEGVIPETRIPRLSHEHWENTIRDLFNLDAHPDMARDFDRDTSANAGEFTTTYRRLVVSEGLWADYQRAAEALAEMVVAPDIASGWLPGGAFPSDGASRDTFVREFGRRAYRRPLSSDEVGRYNTLYDGGNYPGMSPEVSGVRVVVQAMLQSPHFLYRVDLSDRERDDLIEVDQYPLATRLSYLLWGSMPDDILLDAAEAGLLDEEGLREQAARLLDDGRSLELFRQFHTEQWGLSTWADADKDTDVFPDWRPEVAEAMVQEVQMLFDKVIEDGGNFRDFLTSRTAFVNEDLARIYGVEGITGTELQEVELDETRAGLMTRVGFLTHWSAEWQPDPIHRGLFVNTNILCRDVPEAPPVDFDSLMFEGETNRERIASVTHEGICGNCHMEMINPPGFALEHFDAIGQFRALDNGVPVDNTTTFVFEDETSVTVSGGVELSQAVADSPFAHQCYSQRFLEFGMGRPLSGVDVPLVFRMREGSLDGDLSVRDLAIELAASRTVRFRTVENLEEEASE